MQQGAAQQDARAQRSVRRSEADQVASMQFVGISPDGARPRFFAFGNSSSLASILRVIELDIWQRVPS